MTPPEPPSLVGWASQDGGTVGGGDLGPIVVDSPSEFASAIAGAQDAVIHVNGTIEGDFNVGSNKTIIGVCGGEIRGSLSINGQQNIIMRNLTVVGHNCSDSPQECGAGADAIGVQSSHHLWFDHMDISDGSDGNLDMTNNSDFITISWTKFWYSTMRSDPEQGESGHRFSNLIAGSDTDEGEYRITFHHSWWAENIDQRMPRSRFGDIHVFNNLFTSEGNSYCTNAGFSTHLLVENNLYRGVNNPLSPDENGDMRAEGNEFDDVTGNTSDNGGAGFDPPYDYDLDPTDGLDALIPAEAGPRD
jgi:pectate lyase